MGLYRRTRLTASSGHAFWVYRDIVPRLPDEYLEYVVYLYASESDAERGDSAGGTGFLVTVAPKDSDGKPTIYAVTNAHVINDGFPVIALNRREGGRAILPSAKQDWICHPAGDDVAIALLGLREDSFRFRAIGMEDWFLTDQRMKSLNIGPGDEVVFPGRFRSHPGKEENLPIVRFGHIAMMPIEPVWNPGLKHEQESFLVEAHSLSGFSGSPVFVYIPPGNFRWGADLRSPDEAGFYLMGIDWAHFPDFDNPKQNSGIMAVVPVWKLEELLGLEEIVVMREEHGRMEAIDDDNRATVIPDVSAEYERFEDLTRRLLMVPSKDVEEAEETTSDPDQLPGAR